MANLNKIASARHHQTTYSVGLLQSKAFAYLTAHMSSGLLSYGITPKEWALLGLVHDRKSIRPTEAAIELGVEAPYVTAMSLHLKEKDLLEETKDSEDTRAKQLRLTQRGMAFIKKVEPELREHMRPLVSEASLPDLLGYLSVLLSITNQYKK